MRKDYEAPADKALKILSLTGEGAGLNENDYYLVSQAIRGKLDGQETELLYRLHAQVVTGVYQGRWHMGVFPMTLDEHGNLHYKRIRVLTVNEVPEQLHAAALEELSHRCRHLETINADINAATTMDKRWLMLSELSFEDPYVALICRVHKVIRDRNRILICLRAYPFGADSDAVGCARWNGENWMVMNYRSPRELDAYLAKFKPSAEREVVDILSMTGREAVRYFQEIGVPHDLHEQVISEEVMSTVSPGERYGQAGQFRWGSLANLI